MADEEAPPKVGSEVFADEIRAGDERKVAAEKEEVTPPKVGPEIFSQPQPLDENDGKPVENPVGSEVFSEKQLEGIIGEPILSPGDKGAAAATDVPATPAAQAHADELGVDLSEVKGTGKDGVVTKADVADHAAGS